MRFIIFAMLAVWAGAAQQTELSLEEMDDAVLEAICTDRGFELMKDGTEFTHEQYVEAARQCLELEVEMNKLLEENPELLQEFQAAEEAAVKDEVSANPPATMDASSTTTTAASTPLHPSPELDTDGDVLDLDLEDSSPDASAVPDAGASPAFGLPPSSTSTDTDAGSVPLVPDIDAPPVDTPEERTPDTTPDAILEPSSGTTSDTTETLGDLSKGNSFNPAGLSMAEFWSEFKAKVSSSELQSDKIGGCVLGKLTCRIGLLASRLAFLDFAVSKA